jgi:hypothetical protein
LSVDDDGAAIAPGSAFVRSRQWFTYGATRGPPVLLLIWQSGRAGEMRHRSKNLA